MKTYKITCSTNGWIASRDAHFPKGKTEYTVESNLSLKEAYKSLLDIYNVKFDTDFKNWGLAVINDKDSSEGARPTFQDKTRSFEYDSSYYRIEEEVQDEEE